MSAAAVAAEPTDADLAALSRAGDRDAADRLIRRHQGVVWKNLTFKRLRAQGAPPGTDPRDLAQECFLAVWKAIPRWNPGRGKFSTFMTIVVRNEVSDCLRRERARREVPSDPQAEPDEADGFTLALVPAPTGVRIDVVGILGKLSALDRGLVRSVFGLDGEPLGVVAAGNRFGMTRTQAMRVIDAALERLRGTADPDDVG